MIKASKLSVSFTFNEDYNKATSDSVGIGFDYHAVWQGVRDLRQKHHRNLRTRSFFVAN